MRNDEVIYLTSGEAARVLNLTRDGVRWLESQGRLQSTRTMRGLRLYRKSHVLDLLARRDAAAAAMARGEVA